MISRRDFVQLAAATAAILPAGWTKALAQQRLTQAELLRFEPLGNVTLVHIADLHAQLRPIYFREPSINLGTGDVKGLVPHITGKALLDHYNIPAGSADAYSLTYPTISAALAKCYGRLGGLDRIATILKAIRAERGERTIVPRRRRYLAEQLHRAADQRRRHGRLHGAAEARCHDRPLGIHARHRSRQGDHRRSWIFRSSRRTCATPNGTSPPSSRGP